jgi:aldehyde dehydrogenase (NAD+)
MSDLSVQLTAPNGRTYTQPIGLFINNEWVKSSDGDKITSINPTYVLYFSPRSYIRVSNKTRDESEITAVYAASTSDVDRAVKAARKALHHPSWRDLPSSERGRLMIRLSQLVEQHRETLATIETWDNGKPYAVALNEDLWVAEVFRYYGGFADKMFGQVIDTTPEKFAYTLREPVGVCGQIIPFVYTCNNNNNE